MLSVSSQTEITGSLRRYLREEVVIVHKTKDRFGGLSNMASGFPVRVNGVRILTIEALYQACRFPHLPEVQREIIKQHSPMTAKMKSKPHRAKSRSDWDDVRFKIMRWCLRVKLAQNYERFGYLLLSTENRQIVEFSRKDDYWGAVAAEDDEAVLVGQNILGRLLMELRDKYRDDPEQELRAVPVLNIKDFQLFGRAIEPVTDERAVVDAEKRQQAML